MKNVGIAFDNFSGNTGDEAIGISMKEILNSKGVNYTELYPCSNTSKYKPIIIGGGHLLRELTSDQTYNQFRIYGPHILNAMGIHGNPMDLDYLNEYQYVSVRSQGDRNKINYINNVKITPCTTMLLKDKLDFNFRLSERAVGIHLYPELLSTLEISQFVDWSKSLIAHGYTIYFIPITMYRNDHESFKPLIRDIGTGSELVPAMGALEIFTFIGKLRCMISYSLHGAIFAYVHNVPFLLSNIYDKNQFFMEDRGLMKYCFKSISELINTFKTIEDLDYSDLIIQDMNTLREHIYTTCSML
jgi:hypothetical protein